ncbi:hypothetical protein Aduo_003293 [Ancylostoma duodenale]
MFVPRKVILLGKECRGSRVSPEIKKQIVEYHKQRREIHPIEWDCRLEEIARGTMKNATTRVNTEKVGKRRGLNFFEYDKQDRKQYTEAKDIVNYVLEYWWSSEHYARCNMKDKTMRKFGCSYKDGDVFLFACVYEKRAC